MRSNRTIKCDRFFAANKLRTTDPTTAPYRTVLSILSYTRTHEFRSMSRGSARTNVHAFDERNVGRRERRSEAVPCTRKHLKKTAHHDCTWTRGRLLDNLSTLRGRVQAIVLRLAHLARSILVDAPALAEHPVCSKIQRRIWRSMRRSTNTKHSTCMTLCVVGASTGAYT